MAAVGAHAVMSARMDLPIHASYSPRHCRASVGVADGEDDDLADDVWRRGKL